ncbi:hypothetical protein COCON_G00207320 [Conger conger]|uniref:Uncharacterized protein n=1 Tax=Conger conger TaxID=82655 RepID=A0A9Q1HNH7_CONCO|nr:hypothetical protein COCON_G00207320 [Conger conger]
MSGACSISIEIETEDGAVTGAWRPQQDHATGDEADLFLDKETHSWASNHSANNNSLTFARGPPEGTREMFMDVHRTAKPCTDTWPDMRSAKESPTQNSNQTSAYLKGVDNDSNFVSPHKPCPLTSSTEHTTYVNMCFEVGDDAVPPHECHPTTESPPFQDLSSGATVRGRGHKEADNPRMGGEEDLCSSARGGGILLKTKTDSELWDENSDTLVGGALYEKGVVTQERCVSRVVVAKVPPPTGKRPPHHAALSEADSGAVTGCSSISMVDIEDYDDVVLDVTSGVFVALPKVLPLEPLQKQAVTPDSVDSVELTSSSSSCETFSPASIHSSTQPKALDSGYDTENNESPEFIPKEPPESRDLEGFSPPSGKIPLSKGPKLAGSDDEVVLQVDVVDEALPMTLPSNGEPQLTELGGKNPYRDSAYFSDYDNENERFPGDEGGSEFPEIPGEEAEKGDLTRSARTEGLDPPLEKEEGGGPLSGPEETRTIFERDMGKMSPEGARSELRPSDSPIGPVVSTLSPSPPEMGGCLTKESSQDEGLGLDPEHSGRSLLPNVPPLPLLPLAPHHPLPPPLSPQARPHCRSPVPQVMVAKRVQGILRPNRSCAIMQQEHLRWLRVGVKNRNKAKTPQGVAMNTSGRRRLKK